VLIYPGIRLSVVQLSGTHDYHQTHRFYGFLFFILLFFFQLILFVYFKKGMQEGNKFKGIIFLFKILFFFISWNAKSLIKFYIEVFSNSHAYGKPIFI
jgi:hypothetical protein